MLKILDKTRLSGSEAEILALLGMTSRDPVADRIRALVRVETKTARDLLEPQGIWSTKEIHQEASSREWWFGNHVLLDSQDLKKHLSGFRWAVLMAVTIGSKLENEVELLFKKREYARAAVLDAAGSQLAEEAADQLTELFLKAECLELEDMTRRFSPGYGDWDVQVQRHFLEELDAGKIGLGCNEANILVPRKSITAIAGYFPKWAVCRESSRKD